MALHAAMDLDSKYLRLDPILHHQRSARLLFRKLKSSDNIKLMEFFNDDEAVHLFNVPDDRLAYCNEWIDRQLNRYEENQLGLCALELLRTGELVGMAGILSHDIDGIKEIEVGYHLIRKYWGKGYATEAALVCQKYALENNFAKRIISIIHVDNQDSMKVAIRNGLKKGRKTVFRDFPVYIFST